MEFRFTYSHSKLHRQFFQPLTVNQFRPAVTDVRELIQNQEYVGYFSNSFVFDILIGLGFQESSRKAYASSKECDRLLSLGSKNGGIAAAFDESVYMKLILARSCSNYTLVEAETFMSKIPYLNIQQFKTGGFSFEFRRDSHLVADVSRAILKVAEKNGRKQKDGWIGDERSCPGRVRYISSSVLGLDSFWGLFLIAGVVSFSALLIYTVMFVHAHREILNSSSSEASALSRILHLLRTFDQKDPRADAFREKEVNGERAVDFRNDEYARNGLSNIPVQEILARDQLAGATFEDQDANNDLHSTPSQEIAQLNIEVSLCFLDFTKFFATMGNCFSIQLSGGDALITCIASRFNYLPQLKDNLEKLADERDDLRALKDLVKQRVANQQGPQMRQLDVVRDWVSKVEVKLAEVDGLIKAGEKEKNKLCFGGYCSKTCCSTYSSAKKIIKRLAEVAALKEKGNFEDVVERVFAEPECISQLEKDLLALQAATEELKARKDDVIRRVKAEERQETKQLETVKVWISRVDCNIPQFDTLIRDGPQQVQRLREGDLSFSNFAERVATALTDAVAMKQKGDFEAVVGRVPIEPVVARPSEPAVGLERKLEEVWNSLMDEDIGVVGIYGMGGVGKTTLLTETNNRLLNSTKKFDFVIWVIVSKDLRLENMQDEIAEQIGLSRNQDWKKKQFFVKATDIFNSLLKKKFLLLLDDLWERVELKDLGIPPPNNENKSKVVFTTRSEEVCGEMEVQMSIKVEPFAWEEAWKLFQEKVGRRVLDAHPDIPHLAEEVAKECDGLPLALVTVGRAMACRKTPQEWKHALESLRTSAAAFQGMRDKIFPKLKFSYDNLPNEKVRSCLLYCTLFPEDFEIPKEKLIQKWVCENFWDYSGNSQIDAMNEGYSIVAKLVHLCLLEDKGKRVKMHDVIRDMCLWIACEVEQKKENYFVRTGSQLTKAPDMGKVTEARRISLMQNNIRQLTEVPETPSLLTLFLCENNELKVINDGFFQHMKALTVLDLSKTALEVLPTGISELVSLQYLDISATGIEALPWELTNLKNLKYFNLQSNILLKFIPEQMMPNFQLLQVLKMKGCGFEVDTSMIKELGCLEDLKELSITIRGDPSVLHHLLSNHKLSSCIEKLEIEDLEESSSSFSANKEQDTEAETSSPSRCDELVETKTQTLGRLHKSLRERCFTSVHTVEVYGCNCFQDLTWLILAPNLTHLKVHFCANLEDIVSRGNLGEIMEDDDQYDNLNAFSGLQVLHLFYLPHLQSICWKPMLFPSLDVIIVIGCPMLKKLPLNTNSAKGRNLEIRGTEDWWNGLEWEDDSTRTAFTGRPVPDPHIPRIMKINIVTFEKLAH